MDMQINILIGFAIGLMILEIVLDLMYKKGFYNRCDTIKNLFLGLTALFSRLSVYTLKISCFVYFSQFAPLQLPLNWITYLVGFFLYDLITYFFHRLGHESRFFWAAHVNHHSSEEFNYSVALRNPMVNGFYKFIFWTPIVLLGFPPEVILLNDIVAAYYGAIIHTKMIRNFGILDHVLNSPSHHRVHHACNDKYLDKNYSQVLIIWDKLFGTFQMEEEEPQFGITKKLKTNNPFKLIFHEFVDMGKDVRKARSIKEGWFLIFGSPSQIESYKKKHDF